MLSQSPLSWLRSRRLLFLDASMRTKSRESQATSLPTIDIEGNAILASQKQTFDSLSHIFFHPVIALAEDNSKFKAPKSHCTEHHLNTPNRVSFVFLFSAWFQLLWARHEANHFGSFWVERYTCGAAVVRTGTTPECRREAG